LLHQQLTSGAGGLRWVTHFQRTVDGANWDDLILHTAPADQPRAQFSPYIGDYACLLALANDFYGIFCGNNTPDRANFPNGVVYQRNADFDARTLLDVDNSTPVEVSIDPFFFKVSGGPGPAGPPQQPGLQSVRKDDLIMTKHTAPKHGKTVTASKKVVSAANGGPITDVNTLPTVAPDVAIAIKTACSSVVQGPALARMALGGPAMAFKPGSERWPVKTGQDDDVDLVGKNVIKGTDFGAGIVEATPEELIAMPRTPDMADVNAINPAFQSKRALPLETVIWRIKATIIELKHEQDGDYHLVLQGDTGATMIGEVPMPSTEFVGDSPWLDNIQAARTAVDEKLVNSLQMQDFVPHPSTGMLVPKSSLPAHVRMMLAQTQAPVSFRTPPPGKETTQPTFKTRVPATPAVITGVGFFDKVHGQDGVSQSNGIELHPVLKIEWL
jgi:hypothetical protein